ncbi:MAG: ThiF family adenylyltransferase, partial [Myxococcaceae bacterium]|nr:ThiF family adenylyltransferase [Myxococcaceae bacterium]
PRRVPATEAGFLLSPADTDASLGDALEPGVRALNPDALDDAPGRVRGELGEVPARFSGEGPRVALGRLCEGGGVAFAAAGACGACFGNALRHLEPGLDGPGSVVGASVAALMAQRLVLGLTRGVGLLVLEPEGGLVPREVPKCGTCQ